MKEGWDIRKLGSLCSVNRDSGIHSNMPYVGMENIGSGTGLLVSYGDNSAVIGTTNLFHERDVLYGKLRPYLKKVVVAESSGCCSTEIIPITCSENLYPEYLKYWFLEDAVTDKINATCGGCRMPRANMKDVFLFEVPTPSVCEQQRIVDILDKEFAKIDELKSNAEQNLQNAKDLFQAALKKELEPKSGWKTATIAEIAEIKGGKRVPQGYKLTKENTNHPYIRVSDFNDSGSVDLTDIHYISEEVYQGIKRYTISQKDVYLSIAGTIGKSGIVPVELEGANLTENACKLVLREGMFNQFVYYFTTSEGFKEQINKLTMQAAQPKLALTRLATVDIAFPSLQEQQSIVSKLDDLNAKCKVLQDNYTKTIALCDDLKQSLLRKAFNGEL